MANPLVKAESPFWKLPISTLLEQLAASPDGLSSVEAALRLARFGPNFIHGERKKALFLQFIAKFKNPLVIFIIRTRKNPLKSRPTPWQIACSLTVEGMKQ